MSNHPPMIDRETFDAARKQKIKRSNVVKHRGRVSVF